MVLETIANRSGLKALQVRVLHLPPMEGTAEWSATGLENRGAVTRRGSIPLPSSINFFACI